MYDRNGNTGKYCSISGKKPYNMNGNTSEYCFNSGRQSISTRGIVILVSTAPLVDRTSVKQER